MIQKMIVFAGLFIGLCYSQEKLPTFSLEDFSGVTHQSTEYEGSPLLIDMWATWCTTCAKSIPLIKKINATYGPQGLKTIGISIDSQKGRKTDRFIGKYEMDYLLLWDPKNSMATLLQYTAIPSFFLYDAKGNLLFAMRGFDENAEEELLKHLRDLFPAQEK